VWITPPLTTYRRVSIIQARQSDRAKPWSVRTLRGAVTNARDAFLGRSAPGSPTFAGPSELAILYRHLHDDPCHIFGSGGPENWKRRYAAIQIGNDRFDACRLAIETA
jgi:hypothetical protein